MPDKTKPAPSPVSESQATELQMRRALGLQGPGRPVAQQRPEQARARHRFVQDGSVPVVMLNRADDLTAPLKSRIAELETLLEAERIAHSATKKALHDTQLAGQALQTRLIHADLAHNDALAMERQAREAAEAARQQAAARLAATAAAQQAKQTRRKSEANSLVEPEAQPVKWWLPNYKAKNG